MAAGCEQVVHPFGREVLLVVFESVDGLLGDVPVDGFEDPVVPTVLGLDALLEIGAAGSKAKAACVLRVTVTPAMDMEALEAGINRTILDGSDQFSR